MLSLSAALGQGAAGTKVGVRNISSGAVLGGVVGLEAGNQGLRSKG